METLGRHYLKQAIHVDITGGINWHLVLSEVIY